MTDSIRRPMRRMIAGAGLALVVACTPIARNTGYIPTDSDLAQIVVGQDTRESVVASVGPPATGGILKSDTIYYVQSRFETIGPAAPVEVDRQVLAISFAANGTVANIERFGLQDGRVVSLSRRVTSDNVRDTTFLRQLFGSIGRVNAADFVGEQ